MSARTLATGCALALFVSAFVPRADAAPRASTTKPAARRTPASRTKAATTTKPAATLVPATATATATPASTPTPTPSPLPPPAVVPVVVTTPVATPTPTLRPAPAPAPAPDADRPTTAPSSLQHRATITLNPLALAIGRYGANAEFVFATHHAITASGYFQTFPEAILRKLVPDVPLGNGPQSRLGGEIGYRLYTGSDGPTGVFIGPSLVAMPLAAPRLGDDYRAEVVSFMAYGAALDLGVQAVVGPGFTLGGGIGVMALAYSPPASATPPAGIELPSYPEPHVLPRVLVAAGWAF